MNKYIVRLCLLIGVVSLFSSCGSTMTSHKASAISFEPDVVRLDVTLDDFEYLGSVEVSVDYRTYLGVITSVDMVNGEAYMGSREATSVSFSGINNMKFAGPISKSLYKVIETYPDADYYVPTVSQKKTNQLFLGSSSSYQMTFKAYKFLK